MACDWEPFVDLVERHKIFLITTHVRPDGDALGSEIALAAALRQKGKTARIVNVGPLTARYDFLDPLNQIEEFSAPGNQFLPADALIVVDTGAWSQLEAMANFISDLSAEKVVVDHHVTQDDLGATRFVDTSAEAAGRLIYEAIQALDVPFTDEIVNALFVAVATDTGWFRHGNVTPETFVLAEELMRNGARPTFLFQNIFERITPARLRLTGRVMSRVEATPDKNRVYSVLYLADYEAARARPADGEDIVNHTVGLAGATISLLFTEQEDGRVKVSFRSRDESDVSAIAQQFGGGGHRNAAGATIEGNVDEVCKKVIQVVDRTLEAENQPLASQPHSIK